MTANPTDETRQLFATSSDGATIAIYERGSGPPLLLIHGALMDHHGWNALSPHLRQRLTLYTIDRRGRGASTGTSPYAIEREIEDVNAVIQAIGGPIDVFAHSSGALLTLLAAERGLPMRRLILYEPPIILESLRPLYPIDLSARVAALAQTDPGLAVRAFLREGPLWSEAEIERLAAEPSRWAALLRMAPTAAYDAAIVGSYRFDPDRLRRIANPTLILAGAVSPPWYRGAADLLTDTLPNARLAVIPGQGHMGFYIAPDLVAAEVLPFLSK